MAQLIKAGGKYLIAGMRWLHPGAADAQTDPKGGAGKSRQRRSGAAKERALAQSNKAILVGGSTLSTWGYLTAGDKRSLGKLPMFGKVYSLAEMFSGVPELPVYAILIAQIDDSNSYAMCAALSGHPAPGHFDAVVRGEDVEQTLQAWDQQLRAVVGKAPVVYGTWASAGQSLSLDRLIAITTARRPLRTVGADNQKVGAALTVVALGVAAWLGYGEWEKAQGRKNAQILAQQHNPAAVYNKALAEQWPSLQWANLERLRVLSSRVSSIPRSVGGFKLSSDIDCDVIAGTCKFSYKRAEGEGGTFSSFRDDIHGRFVPVTFGQDGATVEVLMTVTDLPTSPPPDYKQFAAEDKSPFLFWPAIQSLPQSLVRGAMQADYKVFPQGLTISDSGIPSVIRSVGVTLTYPLWAAGEMPPPSGVFKSAINWKRMTVNSSSAEVTLAGEMYATKTNS